MTHSVVIVTRTGHTFHLSVSANGGPVIYGENRDYQGWCASNGGVIFISTVWAAHKVPKRYLVRAKEVVRGIKTSKAALVFPFSLMSFYSIEDHP